MSSGVFAVTPTILSMRMEKLVLRVQETLKVKEESEEKYQRQLKKTVRICRVYIQELEEKQVFVLSQDEIEDIVYNLLQIEVVASCGVCEQSQLATAKFLRDKIVKKLVDYECFCKRLVNDALSSDDVGAFYKLPADIKDEIANILYMAYVF